ncbi:MAG: DUF6320 domain-containing protein, partial [Eubacterium sp.]|nr:DUF6320 domain-containing protein [Eubacterium sp.]
MQQCNRCQIRIRGSKRVCPLCGGALSGTPEDPAFPALPRRKFSRMSAVKLAAFLLIAFLITDALIIYLLNGVPSWMPLAVFSAAVGFVDICILAYFRNNILKNMQFQVVVGIVLSIVIDYSTGWYRWSI